MNFIHSSSSFSSLDLKASVKPKTRSKNYRQLIRRSRFSLLRIFSRVRKSFGLFSYLSCIIRGALSHCSFPTADFASLSFCSSSRAFSKILRSTFIPSAPIGVSTSVFILSGIKISILSISMPINSFSLLPLFFYCWQFQNFIIIKFFFKVFAVCAEVKELNPPCAFLYSSVYSKEYLRGRRLFICRVGASFHSI